MATQARLQAEEVSYAVGERSILDAVSLAVRPGEMVGLIGPNGAGKTSLLRAISGLVAPSKGRVLLEGTPLKQLDPAAVARVIAHVPQSTTIDFGFTCVEIVLMGRHPHLGRFAMEGPRDYRIAEAAMTFTGTTELAQQAVTTASGGERQRVLAARALAQEPRVLLLDEPTANLDVLHQLQLLELIRELVRRRGYSAIAAIHDLQLAARYCDRLILMKDGRTVAEGPPAEVLTAERIHSAFGAKAIVRPDAITGTLSITILSDAPRNGEPLGRVHVIGGGGAGACLMYELQRDGYQVSTGVLSEDDTDYQAARLLGVEVAAVPPYSPIDDQAHARNVQLAASADCVVVSATPLGQGNLRNIEAAEGARRLVLVEPETFEGRDYTGGRATAIYERLRERATAATASDVVERVREQLGLAGAVTGIAS